MSLTDFFPPLAALALLSSCIDGSSTGSADVAENGSRTQIAVFRDDRDDDKQRGVIEWGGQGISFRAYVRGSRVSSLADGREYEFALKATTEQLEGMAVFD